MRGDAPRSRASLRALRARSPHARGCTARRHLDRRNAGTVPRMRGDAPVSCEQPCADFGPFPACAGMHRPTHGPRWRLRSVPRMRGDAPKVMRARPIFLRRSPHARGCTGKLGAVLLQQGPFPACAGMHRRRHRRRAASVAVPRMRGDAPTFRSGMNILFGRSPHARGCTDTGRRVPVSTQPFPACAGMHRRWSCEP